MKRHGLTRDIHANEKLFYCSLLFCGLAIVSDFFLSWMYSSTFTYCIIAITFIVFLFFLIRRLNSTSFQASFWFIDIQVSSFFLILALFIVGTGLSSPLEWLYREYWYLYIIAFIVPPIFMELNSGALSFHKNFACKVQLSASNGRISDTTLVAILLSRRKSGVISDGKVAAFVSAGSGLGLYWTYQLGMHYVLYACFLGLIPAFSAILHVVLARRWGIYSTLGLKDIKIDFTEKSLTNVPR